MRDIADNLEKASGGFLNALKRAPGWIKTILLVLGSAGTVLLVLSVIGANMLRNFFENALLNTGAFDNVYILRASAFAVAMLTVVLLPIVVGQWLLFRHGSAATLTTLLYCGWMIILGLLSSSNRTEFFNPLTGTPRCNFYQDANGIIEFLPQSFTTHPVLGVPLKAVTPEIMLMWEQQHPGQSPVCRWPPESTNSKSEAKTNTTSAADSTATTAGQSAQASSGFQPEDKDYHWRDITSTDSPVTTSGESSQASSGLQPKDKDYYWRDPQYYTVSERNYSYWVEGIDQNQKWTAVLFGAACIPGSDCEVPLLGNPSSDCPVTYIVDRDGKRYNLIRDPLDPVHVVRWWYHFHHPEFKKDRTVDDGEIVKRWLYFEPATSKLEEIRLYAPCMATGPPITIFVGTEKEYHSWESARGQQSADSSEQPKDGTDPDEDKLLIEVKTARDPTVSEDYDFTFQALSIAYFQKHTEIQMRTTCNAPSACEVHSLDGLDYLRGCPAAYLLDDAGKKYRVIGDSLRPNLMKDGQGYMVVPLPFNSYIDRTLRTRPIPIGRSLSLHIACFQQETSLDIKFSGSSQSNGAT